MPFRLSTQQKPTVGGLNGTMRILESDAGDRAEIWPALGFNCYSWQTVRDGSTLDLLYADPQLFGNGRPTRSGIPVLFPFPNRIRDARYTWAGRNFHLAPTDATKKHAIHGFACRRPWRIVNSGADTQSAWLTGEFRLSADDPESQSTWPADCTMRLTYRLLSGRLRLEAEVFNPDRLPLPFGLGYHPYFNVPFVSGSTEDVQIEVPAESYWVLQDCLPTAERLPVDASRDLTKPRSFAGVTVDDVLTDIQPGSVEAPAGMRWNGSLRQAGRALHVFSSLAFRELVVFTPPHRQAFCIEPYTCPTDAVNLTQRGMDVGWLILEPGARWTAVVELATH